MLGLPCYSCVMMCKTSWRALWAGIRDLVLGLRFRLWLAADILSWVGHSLLFNIFMGHACILFWMVLCRKS